MSDPAFPLAVVDGACLDEEVRALLRPGEVVRDRHGHGRRLPRYFYEVPSWQAALELQITPHFALWEFLNVDVREHPRMREFPRYVPCAVTLMATCLELFREEVGTLVHIAANGGYRSPAHALSEHASPHSWASAVNIYRIGDAYLDDQERIERFGRIATRVIAGAWARPYGSAVGQADDHLHLDVGYARVAPRNAPGEEAPEAEEEREE